MSTIDHRPMSSVNQYIFPSIAGDGCSFPEAAKQSQLMAMILSSGIKMDAVKITSAIG